jgi:hypothetical protein
MPTIFEADVEEYVAIGFDRPIAIRMAIDYYRKFTRREQSINRSNWKRPRHGYDAVSQIEFGNPDVELLSSVWIDCNLLPDERVAFRQLVDRILEYIDSIKEREPRRVGKKWLAQIIRTANLESILSEQQQEWVDAELGNALPQLKKDLATVCGYKVRGSARTTQPFEDNLETFQNGLRDYLHEIEYLTD